MRDFFQVSHRYQIPIYIEPEKKEEPEPTKVENFNLNVKSMFIPLQNPTPTNPNLVQMRTN